MSAASLLALLVRKKKSWIPLKLAILSAWYVVSPLYCFSDAAGIVPCVDTDPIQVWKDKSGNGRTYSQATLGNRPIFRLINGKWYARFTSGNSTFMNRANPITFGTNSFSVFLASNRNGGGGVLGGDVNSAAHFSNGGAFERQGIAALGSEAVSSSDSVLRTAGFVWNSAGAASTTSFYKDGAANGVSGPFAAQNFDQPNNRIGGGASSKGFCSGDIGEIVESVSLLSANDIANLMKYLKRQWGTP